MQLAAIGLVVGALAGVLAGGRPDLRRFRSIRAPWLFGAAVVFYAIAWAVDDLPGEGSLVALAVGSTAAGTVANIGLTGAGVLAVGLGCNLVPLALDGATPVDPAAAVTVELATFDDVDDVDLGVGRRLETDDDRFVFLGDVIPLEPTGWVVSFGDLIAAVGLANVVFRLLRPGDDARDDPFRPPDRAAEDDSDAWTAMLRGDISEDTYRRQTARAADAPRPAEPAPWSADGPLPTGPLVVTGTGQVADDRPTDESEDDVDLTVLSWKAPEPPAPPPTAADPPSVPPPDADAEPPEEAAPHVLETGPIDSGELSALLGQQVPVDDVQPPAPPVPASESDVDAPEPPPLDDFQRTLARFDERRSRTGEPATPPIFDTPPDA